MMHHQILFCVNRVLQLNTHRDYPHMKSHNGDILIDYHQSGHLRRAISRNWENSQTNVCSTGK